jgi:hypothetical protein
MTFCTLSSYCGNDTDSRTTADGSIDAGRNILIGDRSGECVYMHDLRMTARRSGYTLRPGSTGCGEAQVFPE